MALHNCVIKLGATAITMTGGTDNTFTPDGDIVQGGVHVGAMAQTNFIIRDHILFKNRNARLQGDGTYTKSTRETLFVSPIVLASGKTAFNRGKLVLEIHPESTAAEVLDLCMVMAQLAGSTSTIEFQKNGNLA